MSNENQEPNTVELSHHQSKPSLINESILQKTSPKPSTIFTNIENPANAIVANNVPKTTSNIFGNTSRPSTNLFAQTKTKTINLFAINSVPQTTGTNNIFKTSSKPLIASQNEEGDNRSESNASSGSEGVNRPQKDFKSVPAELVMKFKYENPWTVIKTFDLRKFKNGVNNSKEHIYMTLERNSQFSDKLFFIVRSKDTKVVMFQGFGLKNVTDKMSNFMGKEQNLKFSVIIQNVKSEKETEEGIHKPDFSKEELKVQFESEEDANEFRRLVEAEIGGRKEEAEKGEGEKEDQKKE